MTETLMRKTGLSALLLGVVVVALLTLVALPRDAAAAECTSQQLSNQCATVYGATNFGSGVQTIYCDCSRQDGATMVVNGEGYANGNPTEPSTGETNPNLLEGIFSLILQVVVIILYLTLYLSNFLLWLAGMLFNTVFVETVLQFGQNFGNTPGVLTAWTVLRDLGNIFLLFSFVFMGIATILNLHDYTVKKTLPRLIIFAVLLNFSLFAAEAVVDVSNGVSAAIVGQAIPNTECTETGTALQTGRETLTPGDSPAERCTKEFGITGLVMNNSHLSAVLNVPEYQDNAADLDQTFKQLATLFGLSIFSSILSVVFFAAAILLIIRVIVLTFIIVTAPIGFAGMAVPFMGGIANRWWHELVNQSLFVPIFLLLVFVGLKVVEGSGLSGSGGGNITDALGSGDISAFSVIVTFAVTAGFFLAALMVAKRFGAIGADAAIKTAGDLTYGSLGFVGRRTLGYGAYNLARAWHGSGGSSIPVIGRSMAGLLNKGATSSFDFRGTNLAKAGTGFAGVDLGGASGAAHHGIEGIIDEEKGLKLKHAEAAEEEHERVLETRQNEYRRYDMQYQEAGGDAALKAGDAKARQLFDKRRDAIDNLMKNDEGRLYLQQDNHKAEVQLLEALKRQMTELTRQAKSFKDQAARTSDPIAKAGLLASADNLDTQANGMERNVENQQARVDDLTEEMSKLEREIRYERLRDSRQLARSAEWSRFIPFSVGPDSDRLASNKEFHDEYRDASAKQTDKIVAAIASMAGKGGGGSAAKQAAAVEHAVDKSAHGSK